MTKVQSSGQVAGVIPYIMGNNKMPELVFRLAFYGFTEVHNLHVGPPKSHMILD